MSKDTSPRFGKKSQAEKIIEMDDKNKMDISITKAIKEDIRIITERQRMRRQSANCTYTSPRSRTPPNHPYRVPSPNSLMRCGLLQPPRHVSARRTISNPHIPPLYQDVWYSSGGNSDASSGPSSGIHTPDDLSNSLNVTTRTQPTRSLPNIPGMLKRPSCCMRETYWAPSQLPYYPTGQLDRSRTWFERTNGPINDPSFAVHGSLNYKENAEQYHAITSPIYKGGYYREQDVSPQYSPQSQVSDKDYQFADYGGTPSYPLEDTNNIFHISGPLCQDLTQGQEVNQNPVHPPLEPHQIQQLQEHQKEHTLLLQQHQLQHQLNQHQHQPEQYSHQHTQHMDKHALADTETHNFKKMTLHYCCSAPTLQNSRQVPNIHVTDADNIGSEISLDNLMALDLADIGAQKQLEYDEIQFLLREEPESKYTSNYNSYIDRK